MNARSGISLKEESEPYLGRKQEETPMTIQDSPSLYDRLGGVPWILELSQRIVDNGGGRIDLRLVPSSDSLQ